MKIIKIEIPLKSLGKYLTNKKTKLYLDILLEIHFFKGKCFKTDLKKGI